MSCTVCERSNVGKVYPVTLDDAGHAHCLECDEIVMYANGLSRAEMQKLQDTKKADLTARIITAENNMQFTDLKEKIEAIQFEELTPTTQIAAIYLAEALTLVAGGRQEDYGDYLDNLLVIARDLGESPDPARLTHYTSVMKGFKRARLQNQPDHYDSKVDDVGYTALLHAVATRIINGDLDGNA